MRRPLPGKGVVEDEHVDAWCADLELALDVLLVGIASGCGNEHLGNKADRKSETEAERAPWIDLVISFANAHSEAWEDSVMCLRPHSPQGAESCTQATCGHCLTPSCGGAQSRAPSSVELITTDVSLCCVVSPVPTGSLL